MPQNHHIDKHKIVISTANGAEDPISRELHDSREEVLRLIEQVFDKYIPEDRLVEIDRIHLDLGSLPRSDFKKEYQHRLITLLEAELQKLTKTEAFRQSVSVAPVVASDPFKLLAEYFFKGYQQALQQQAGFNLDEYVKMLITSDASRFVEAIEVAWMSPTAQKRMKKQLPAATFRQIRQLMRAGATATTADEQWRPVRLVELLTKYFTEGLWPTEHKSKSVLRIDFLFRQLKPMDRKRLTSALLTGLNEAMVMQRVASALSLASLKQGFASISGVKSTLAELRMVEEALASRADMALFPSSFTFKHRWLQYLKEYKSPKRRAELLREWISRQVLPVTDMKRFAAKVEQSGAVELAAALNDFVAGNRAVDTRTSLPGSAMDSLIRFLETGVLTGGGLGASGILAKLLNTQSVLLARVLTQRWSLYQVRYRLAYQMDIELVPGVITLLFGESMALGWLEEMFQTVSPQSLLLAESLPEKHRRDLYFSFFEVMAGPAEAAADKEYFYEQLISTLSAIAPSVDPEDAIGEIEKHGYPHAGAYIFRQLSLQDEISPVFLRKDIKRLLKEVVAEGTTSTSYRQQLQTTEQWQQWFELPPAAEELSIELLQTTQPHDTFWKELLPALKGAHLEALTLQVATFQKDIVETILDELQLLETEFRSEAGTAGAFYPLSKEIYIVLLKALSKSEFSMSSQQLSDLLYTEVFQRLKNEQTALVYDRIVKSLLIRATAPGFEYKHRHLSRWLSAGAHTEILVKKIKKKQGVSENVIKEAYSDEYSTTDLLLFYMEKGDLPRWSALREQHQLATLLEQAILSFDPQLLGRIGALARNSAAIERLITLVSAKAWSKLLAYIEPHRHELLDVAISDLSGLLPKNLKSMALPDLEVFLKVTLLRLAFDIPSGINEGDLRMLLLLIAAKYNVPLQQLLMHLYNDRSSIRSQILKDAVSKQFDLLSHQSVVAWREEAVKHASKGQHTTMDVIQHFILKGRFPSWSAVKNKAEVRRLVMAGLKVNPSAIRELLLHISDKPAAISALASLLKISDLEGLLSTIDPNTFRRLSPVVTDLVTLLPRLPGIIGEGDSRMKQHIHVLLFRVILAPPSKYLQQEDLIVSFLKLVVEEYGLAEEELYQHLRGNETAISDQSLKQVINKYIAEKQLKPEEQAWSTEGIKPGYSDFTTHDLAIYYFRTGRFPDWSAVNTISAMKALLKGGVSKAPNEVADILRSIRGDHQAVARVMDMVGKREMSSILKALDSYRYKMYSAVTVDMLRVKALPEQLAAKHAEISSYLTVLLASELAGPDPHLSSEAFAVFIIEQLATRFGIDNAALYKVLQQNAGNLKSRPLLKSVQDYHSEENMLSEEEQPLEVQVATDIEALLFMIAHRSIPWWYQEEGKKDISVKTELRRLYKKLLTGHTNVLLTAIQSSGDEAKYLSAIFSDTSIDEFSRVIHAIAPGVSGFVVMYIRALEAVSKSHYSSLAFTRSTKAYIYLYQYIRSRKATFTASGFIADTIPYIATHLGIDVSELTDNLISAVEHLKSKGETKFATLLEVLRAEKTAASSVPEVIKQKAADEKAQRADTEDATASVLYFLQHGIVPLRSSIKSYQELLKAFKEQALSDPAALKAGLTTALAKPIALNRIMQHGPQLLIDTAAFLYGIKPAQIESWVKGMEDFMHSGYSNASKSAYRALAFEVVLKALSSAREFKYDQISLIRLYLEEASKAVVPELKTTLQDRLKTYKASPGITKPFIQALESAVNFIAKPLKPAVKEPVREEAAEPLEEPLQIHNAGAVILANFLPRYFDMLEMTAKRAFKDEKTAARAVHLVQYLVTGETETPEHELILNKILCGVELTYPLDRSIELTPKEKEISESLLKGVLQNWSKLKSSSIEALREGFLMRAGYLNETPHNWELKVEESGRDILLDFLPWSFNTIKLSWMEKSLNVHWRNKGDNHL